MKVLILFVCFRTASLQLRRNPRDNLDLDRSWAFQNKNKQPNRTNKRREWGGFLCVCACLSLQRVVLGRPWGATALPVAQELGQQILAGVFGWDGGHASGVEGCGRPHLNKRFPTRNDALKVYHRRRLLGLGGQLPTSSTTRPAGHSFGHASLNNACDARRAGPAARKQRAG
jgi:hypothetical protein